MRHLESPFCHIKEVVDAEIFFRLCYVHLKYIQFHLGITWQLHLIITGNLMRIRVTGVEWTWSGLQWPHA